MKKIQLILLFLFTASIIVHADFYIRGKMQTTPVYDIGTVFPADTVHQEIWIGKKRMLYQTRDIIIIINEDSKRISIINPKSRKYVDSTLPLELSKIVSPGLFQKIQSFQIHGKVIKMKDEKKIDQMSCHSYQIVIDRPYPRETKIWSTENVPFDWKQYQFIQHTVWTLSNYHSDFVNNLNEMIGCWVKTEESFWMDGTEEKSISRLIEIKEKNPPTGGYSIPAGYQKIKFFTYNDFRDMGIPMYMH